MIRTTKKTMGAAILGCAGLLASASSQAGLISYDFTVTIDAGTAELIGESFTGNFSYDDSGVPFTLGDTKLYALDSFTFEFAGNSYSISDLLYGDAALANTTAQFLGLDAATLDFVFLPAVVDPAFAASFSYYFGDENTGSGGVVFSRSTAGVPEPAAALLFGMGLLALARRSSQRNP